MYRDMEEWLEIHRRVLREGVSKRQILRDTGIHWKVLERILKHPPRRCAMRKGAIALFEERRDPICEIRA